MFSNPKVDRAPPEGLRGDPVSATCVPPPGWPPAPYGRVGPPPAAVEAARRASRPYYLLAAALPPVAVAAFLWVGLTVGNMEGTRDAAIWGAMAIALATGPATIALTALGVRAAKRAGAPQWTGLAIYNLVLGALGTVAGVWAAALLWVQLVAGPFY